MKTVKMADKTPFKVVNETDRALFLQIKQVGDEVTIAIREDKGNVELFPREPEIFRWVDFTEEPAIRFAHTVKEKNG